MTSTSALVRLASTFLLALSLVLPAAISPASAKNLSGATKCPVKYVQMSHGGRLIPIGNSHCKHNGASKAAHRASVHTFKKTKRRVARKSARVHATATGSNQRGYVHYKALIAQIAAKHGVPLDLARAVIRVESNFNPRAHGSHGEIGLMQIKPATARGLGFHGSAAKLYDPATNLEFGMRYLARAQEIADGDTCGTILRYNAGHYAKHMNPYSLRYCHRVKEIIASL